MRVEDRRGNQSRQKKHPAGSSGKKERPRFHLQRTWESAFTDADDCIFITDSEQRIAYWNRAGEKLLGHSRREAPGSTCYELIAGRTTVGAWCRAGCPVWRAVKRGERIRDFDLLTVTRDGQPRWVSVAVLVVRHRSKALILHVLRDIGARKRLESLVARLLETFESHGILPARSTAERLPSPAKTDCPPSRDRADLTRRELEVLELLSLGFSTRTIADQLALSPHTVRNHVKHALRKSGLHNRTEAVSSAIRRGLL